MGATGYIISGNNGGSEEPVKTYDVVPADGTIDVERREADNVVTFAVKTTYDGYETINVASHTVAGYVRAIRVKFNESNKRYRLVCILNGASDNTVVKDFAIYYIKMGYDIGGLDYSYIQEYSRIGNGSYVVLEKISTSEYNILMYMPRDWAAANIGVLKEDKEPNVSIKHYNGNVSIHHPTGTIITPDVPTWRNGAPAVWQIIPDVVNPVSGMLGHYYNADRNLYFFDGTNWHLVYSLAQGVASMLATTDAPVTATDGTIYYDTTEGNLKIWINGGWKNIFTQLPAVRLRNTITDPKDGDLSPSSTNTWTSGLSIYYLGAWRSVQAIANGIASDTVLPSTAFNTQVIRVLNYKRVYTYYSDYGWLDFLGNAPGTIYATLTAQVVTFTDYSGETISANETSKIIVTASFGSTSILDFSNIEKVEGKVIEISNLNGNTITMKDGATTLHLTNSNESVIKAICLSDVWHYYKTGSITEFT